MLVLVSLLTITAALLNCVLSTTTCSDHHQQDPHMSYSLERAEWIYDQATVDSDKLHLKMGENIIYVSFGTEMFLNSTVSKLKNVFCADQLDYIDVKSQKDHSRWGAEIQSWDKLRLLVVSNTEELRPEEANKLDFLFRIRDHSMKIGNVIVVILYNVADDSEWNAQNYSRWKEYISLRFNSNSNYFNGKALAGRISRALFQSNENATLEVGSRECDIEHSKDFVIGTLTSVLILSAVIVVVASRSKKSTQTDALHPENDHQENNGDNISDSTNFPGTTAIVGCQHEPPFQTATVSNASTPSTTSPAASQFPPKSSNPTRRSQRILLSQQSPSPVTVPLDSGRINSTGEVEPVSSTYRTVTDDSDTPLNDLIGETNTPPKLSAGTMNRSEENKNNTAIINKSKSRKRKKAAARNQTTDSDRDNQSTDGEATPLPHQGQDDLPSATTIPSPAAKDVIYSDSIGSVTEVGATAQSIAAPVPPVDKKVKKRRRARKNW